MPIRLVVTLAISLLLLGASYAFADGILNDGPTTRSLGGVGNYLFHNLGPVTPPAPARNEASNENLYEHEPARPVVEELKIRQSSAVAPIQSVTFPSGSARISSSERARLDAIADALKSDPELRARITGFADSRGPVAKNEALGEARAKAVFNRLRKSGVPEGQITWKTMGESEPASENDTTEGRARNRRAEIQFE